MSRSGIAPQASGPSRPTPGFSISSGVSIPEPYRAGTDRRAFVLRRFDRTDLRGSLRSADRASGWGLPGDLSGPQVTKDGVLGSSRSPALRSLTSSPRFVSLAALCLSLGIGLKTMMCAWAIATSSSATRRGPQEFRREGSPSPAFARRAEPPRGRLADRKKAPSCRSWLSPAVCGLSVTVHG